MQDHCAGTLQARAESRSDNLWGTHWSKSLAQSHFAGWRDETLATAPHDANPPQRDFKKMVLKLASFKAFFKPATFLARSESRVRAWKIAMPKRAPPPSQLG